MIQFIIYECGICKKRFSGKTNLLKHLKHHEPKQVDNSNSQVEITCEQSTTKQRGDKSIISNDSYNIDVKNEPCILNTDN
jgi:ABC-type phosphate/phosphonate transport system ATPase subunit